MANRQIGTRSAVGNGEVQLAAMQENPPLGRRKKNPPPPPSPTPPPSPPPYPPPDLPDPLDFDELSEENQRDILRMLSFEGLYNFRLALHPIVSQATKIVMQNVVQERTQQLQRVRAMTEIPVNLPPVEFSKTRQLELMYRGDIEELGAVFEIMGSNMPKVNNLSIVRMDDANPNPPPLTVVPDTLATCLNIRTLDLSRVGLNTFPQVVVNLPMLSNLDLSFNPNMGELPNDIGVRMPRLESLWLEGTPAALPESLLNVLENIAARRNRGIVPSGSLITLIFNEMGTIADAELAQTIPQANYPQLYKQIVWLRILGVTDGTMYERRFDVGDYSAVQMQHEEE